MNPRYPQLQTHQKYLQEAEKEKEYPQMNKVQNQWQVSIMIHEIHHVFSNQQATKDENQ